MSSKIKHWEYMILFYFKKACYLLDDNPNFLNTPAHEDLAFFEESKYAFLAEWSIRTFE